MINAEEIRLLIHVISSTYTSFRQAMQHRMREQGIDLTYEMLQILICLWNEEGLKQQKLANLTCKDKASLTYLLNNMEKRDLVRREADISDKRSNRIYLTENGKALRQQVMPLYMKIYEQSASKLNGNGLQECVGFLVEADDVFKELNK